MQLFSDVCHGDGHGAGVSIQYAGGSSVVLRSDKFNCQAVFRLSITFSVQLLASFHKNPCTYISSRKRTWV